MSGKAFIGHFSALQDPRQTWNVVYPLPEIPLVVLCATLGGAEDFVEVARWGQRKLDFLRRLLPYERGIASHDTLNDVMNALPAPLFAACFTAWVESLRETAPDIVAIDALGDGRRLSRRSHAAQDRQRARQHGHHPPRGPQHRHSPTPVNELRAIPLLRAWQSLETSCHSVHAQTSFRAITRLPSGASKTEPTLVTRRHKPPTLLMYSIANHSLTDRTNRPADIGPIRRSIFPVQPG